MKMTEYRPNEQLRPFVKAYRIIESQEGITNRVLSSTSFALAFRLQGQVSYIHCEDAIALPAITLTGLRKTPRLIKYGQNSATLIVLFKEQGVSSFFKHPLHELFGESTSFADYIPQSEVAFAKEQLAEIEDNKSRLYFVEQFLISKLIYRKPDILVTKAIDKINSVNGNVKIKALTGDLCISHDAFEKRFRKATGATPKQFAFIVKMNAMIRRSKLDSSFLELAFENGFYDQPHFNKDFKTFTGQTPSDFFDSPSFW